MGDLTEAVATTPAESGAVLFVLADGAKVKQRLLRMRACNERNAKGKTCMGHLKRWFRLTPAARERFGPEAEIYRCERCHTIYAPNPQEPARTGTLAW
jgi:hypothetical protein